MAQPAIGSAAGPAPQEQPRGHRASVTRIGADSLRDATARHHAQLTDTDESAQERGAKQASLGKLSAMERIDYLTDPGSFYELEGLREGVSGDAPASRGDGVITGHATIHGQTVLVFAQDFTVRGGSFGQVHADKVVRLLKHAEKLQCPVIGLYDGGGARIHEGAMALHGCGSMFRQIVKLSGTVPQLSVVLGPCAGAAAYAPALTDAIFMVRDIGMMYLTGPDVVQAVTGEAISAQALGGAEVHGTHSGVATFVHESEESCLDDVRYLVSLLPPNAGTAPAELSTDDPAERSIDEVFDLVPADSRHSYDMATLIEILLDQGTFIEFHVGWAPNIVCGLGRADGRVVGVVANQPLVRAGVLDSPASEKAARFVSWCDAFSIPIVTLVDVPGFMPGEDIERGGVIRHGAKLLHAYSVATVPRIQVIIRKAYGGAYIVMDSPSIGNDLSYAWPTNEVAVMGAEAAVKIIHRRQIAAAPDEDDATAALQCSYREAHMHPYAAASEGLVHAVIDPTQTRKRIIDGLRLLENKANITDRKHPNSPL